MAIQWLDTTRSRASSAEPTISLWRDGRLGLNEAARKAIASRTVRLGFDPDAGRIYVQPVSENVPGAYVVRTYGPSGGAGYISAAALVALHQITVEATVSRRLEQDKHGFFLQLPFEAAWRGKPEQAGE